MSFKTPMDRNVPHIILNSIHQLLVFFVPPKFSCTVPPMLPSVVNCLPIAPSFEKGPPTFSPHWILARLLVSSELCSSTYH